MIESRSGTGVVGWASEGVAEWGSGGGWRGSTEPMCGSRGFEAFGEWARLFVFVPLALCLQRVQSGLGTKEEELNLFTHSLFSFFLPSLSPQSFSVLQEGAASLKMNC